MAAGYTELFLEQGTSFTVALTIDDVSGSPFNLTGFTGTAQMRKSYYSSNAAATFVVTTGTPTAGIPKIADATMVSSSPSQIAIARVME